VTTADAKSLAWSRVPDARRPACVIHCERPRRRRDPGLGGESLVAHVGLGAGRESGRPVRLRVTLGAVGGEGAKGDLGGLLELAAADPGRGVDGLAFGDDHQVAGEGRGVSVAG